MIWDGPDVIILEIKCTISVMHLNDPQTTTTPPPCPWSVEKLSCMKPVPGAQKGWGPLLPSRVEGCTQPVKDRLLAHHSSVVSGKPWAFPGMINVQWQSVKVSGKLTETQDQRNGTREPGFEVILSNHGILF